MRDSDSQLLQSFATDRNEEAFRVLAKRHLGLVFHTALRRTGNRSIAEEISQNVLLALARKSGALAKEAECLPGWLHRATLFEASKAMRSESSYQRRKQQDPEDAASHDSDAAPPWRDALPHLDLALDKLPEADRRVLLLHYFEDHPFPRIAEQSGKNLAAVQKQAQRALEKLSRILRTKGIALSVTALGAGLATQTAKAVPETLIHSASTYALAGSSSPLAFSLTAMIASKSKVVIPLALLLLATPLALQQLAIAKERDRIQSLRDAGAVATTTDSLTARRGPARASGKTTSSSIDLMVLANEQADATRIGGETRRRFEAKLAGLGTETLADLIRKTGTSPLGKEKKTELLGSLLMVISKTAPGRGLTAAIQGLPEGPSMGTLMFDAGVYTLMSEWTEKDPASAIDWFREIKDLPKLNAGPSSLLGRDTESSELGDLEAHLVYGLIRSSTNDAASYLNGFPETERLVLLTNTINALWLVEMREGIPDDWLSPFLQVMRESVPQAKHEQMVAKLAMGTDWERLPQVLADAGATAAETAILAREVAQEQLYWVIVNRWQYDEESPLDPGVLECVEELVPGRGQEILDEAKAAAEQAAYQNAADSLARVRAGSALSEEQIYQALTEEPKLSIHIPEALELTGRIKDPELRQKAIDYLNAKAQTLATP